MKNSISFVLIFIIGIAATGQSFFEGKITYKNSYKSKIANVSDSQFTTMMGSVQEYYIKGGNYKSVVNGSLAQWQLYINSDNKLYTKMSNAEVVLWNDGATNADEVLGAIINKDVTEVLGYRCDELILVCMSGTQKYYFSTVLPIDTQAYVNHNFGNWYYIISRTKTLPLKYVIENAQFEYESVATDIQTEKIAATFFTLPANVETRKNPY